MRLNLFLLIVAAVTLVIAGCASKGYVDQQISSVKTQYDAELQTVKAETGHNTAEINRLMTLSSELSKKADMALNQSKGFENYKVIWEGSINFDFDSFELSQFGRDQMEELGQKMIDFPRSLLEIAGHTDKSGSTRYNMELGLKRSESVKKYMVDQFGIALYRMFTVSHGETKPVALPDERNANSKNRRVTLKLWGEM